MGPNAFKLDLEPQLAIHDVVNVNQWKLYGPLHLEESVLVTHLAAIIPNFQPPLLKITS